MVILFEMNETTKEQMKEYGVVFEEKSALLQSTVFFMFKKSYKDACVAQARAESMYVKKNYKEAIKLYKKYISTCEVLMKEANQVPDANIKDAILLLIPWFNGFFVGIALGQAIVNKFIDKNNAGIKNGSREYLKVTVRKFIKYGEKMIEKCNKKLNEVK